MGMLNRIKGKQAVVVAAGAAVGAMAGTSRAAVQFTPENIVVSTAGTSTQDLDVNQDSTPDFTMTASTSTGMQIQKYAGPNPDPNNPLNINGIVTNAAGGPAFSNLALALAAGDTISTSSTTDTSATLISADGTTGNFPVSAGVKYIGVGLQPVNGPPDPSQNNFGYIEYQTLSTDPNGVVSGQILGFGYETTLAAPIQAGAQPVPEPASLALLALGAAGLLAKRPRRAR